MASNPPLPTQPADQTPPSQPTQPVAQQDTSAPEPGPAQVSAAQSSGQASGPATAPANTLRPSTASGVHGVLANVALGALAGAVAGIKKVGSGLQKAAPYIPVVAAAHRKAMEASDVRQQSQQKMQQEQQKSSDDAVKSMDDHQKAVLDYNNATLTNHHLVLQAQQEDQSRMQSQVDLAHNFVDTLKQQGIDIDINHGAGHGGLTTQDAADAAQGKTVHIFNGETGNDAGVGILDTRTLASPITHDIVLPLKMEIDPKTGKLKTTDFQTLVADGHNTYGTAFAAFQNTQRMGVQAQTDFDQQQKNIKTARENNPDNKPEATPKTLVESSVALVQARQLAATNPTPENQAALKAAQSQHDQIMQDAKAEAAEKHEASETVPTPSEVDAFAQGRLTLTPYIIGRQPQLVDQILAKYPHFDMTKGESYATLRTEFEKGKVGQGINSFNTALNHIGEMWPHINNLSATKGVQQLAQISGDKDADTVNATKTVLADELGKAYKSGALTEQEHESMEKLLSGRTAPELANNIRTFVSLLQGKLDAYQQQWRVGKPDPSMDDFPVVSPLAQQVIDTVSGKPSGQSQTPTAPAGATHKAPGSDGKMHYTNDKGQDLGVVQ
jgi:hypothetical protein